MRGHPSRLGGDDPGERLAVRGVADGGVGDAPQFAVPAPRLELRLTIVAETVSERARELFAPLGPTYDRYARLLSFGQDPRWRRFLVSRLRRRPEDTVARRRHGTGAVAVELVPAARLLGRRRRPEPGDAGEARRRLGARPASAVRLVEGARELPFEDASFDGLTATYLLRYVDDLPAGLRSSRASSGPARRLAARLRRPACPATRRLGLLGRRGPPARRPRDLARLARGRPLPRRQHPLVHRRGRSRACSALSASRVRDASARRLSLGGCVVVWGRRRMTREPRPGVLRTLARRLARLRDAAAPAVHRLAPELRRDRRGARAATSTRPPRRRAGRFFLALGVGAHALDELHGRPLRRGSRTGRCSSSRALSLGAVAIGIAGAVSFDGWLLVFVAAGALLVARLQPRAVRRCDPQRARLRARLGRVPGPDGLLRLRGDDRLGRASRGRLRGADELRAARALDARPPPAPPRGRGRRDARAARRQQRAGHGGAPVRTQELSLQLLAAAHVCLAGALLVLRLA